MNHTAENTFNKASVYDEEYDSIYFLQCVGRLILKGELNDFYYYPLLDFKKALYDGNLEVVKSMLKEDSKFIIAVKNCLFRELSKIYEFGPTHISNYLFEIGVIPDKDCVISQLKSAVSENHTSKVIVLIAREPWLIKWCDSSDDNIVIKSFIENIMDEFDLIFIPEENGEIKHRYLPKKHLDSQVTYDIDNFFDPLSTTQADQFEQLLNDISIPMFYGAVRGAANSMRYLFNKIGLPKEAQHSIYWMFYAGLMFEFQYLIHYETLSREEKHSETEKHYIATAKAIDDLLSLLGIQILCKAIHRLGETLKYYGWNKAGRFFQWANYVTNYGLYAYQAYMQGLVQILVSIFSGFCAEKIVEFSGKRVVDGGAFIFSGIKRHFGFFGQGVVNNLQQQNPVVQQQAMGNLQQQNNNLVVNLEETLPTTARVGA